MKLNFVILFIINIILFSCIQANRKEVIIEGDLHFHSFRIGNFYGIEDSIIENAEKHLDTLTPKTREDSLVFKVYISLKNEDLLYTPFIQILTNDSIRNIIYLTEKEYKEITFYKLKDLHNNYEKINLRFKAEEIEKGFYISKEMLSLKKIKGETKPKHSNKFGPTDYE